MRKIVPRKEFEVYDGDILPAKERFNSSEFNDNAFYIQTAEQEAQRVVHKFGCGRDSRILEIGCGKGRFAIGLLRVVGPVNYIGLDVHKPSIKWCKKYIESRHSSYHFEYLDVKSDRYNINGRMIDNSFTFNIPGESIDIIYFWGVITNMHESTLRIYMNDLKRMLVPDGKVFFTAFVEDDVPDVTYNPEGYVRDEYTGPLQIVRYNKNYLFSIISEAGLVIDEFNYGKEYDGQSGFYLSKFPT